LFIVLSTAVAEKCSKKNADRSKKKSWLCRQLFDASKFIFCNFAVFSSQKCFFTAELKSFKARATDLSRFSINLCTSHRYRKSQNRLLKVCFVPATSAILPRVSFFFSFLFLLQWPFTVLIKQTRQVVCAIKQSIFLDVYGTSLTHKIQ
jgi:hypothetical protein